MIELKYYGFYGTCKISLDDNCLHGKIKGIADVVMYEADTVKELKEEFKIAVQEYLKTKIKLSIRKIKRVQA